MPYVYVYVYAMHDVHVCLLQVRRGHSVHACGFLQATTSTAWPIPCARRGRVRPAIGLVSTLSTTPVSTSSVV